MLKCVAVFGVITCWLHVGYMLVTGLNLPSKNLYTLSICERAKQNIFISIRVVTHYQPQPLLVQQNNGGTDLYP